MSYSFSTSTSTVDSHCHLAHLPPTDLIWSQFPSYPLLSVSTTLNDALITIKLASHRNNILPAVGLHPWFLSEHSYEEINELEGLLQTHSLSAMGEIGLDFHPNTRTDHQLQLNLFLKQLALAQNYRLPVSIHMVKAVEPVLDALSAYPKVKGVIHGFYGSSEVAARFIQRGYKIGIGGMLLKTEPNKLHRVILEHSLTSFVLETDFPYGRKHGLQQLTDLFRIADKMSEILKLPVAHILKMTGQTASEIFYERS